MKPSARKVLDMLREGPQTTQSLGLACGFRFSARLGELRDAGYIIWTDKLTTGSARYTLISEPESFGDSDTPPNPVGAVL